MFTLDTSELAGPEDWLHGWKAWAAKEVHRRGLLGHYILDGQLAYLSGQSACGLHVTNPLYLSACSRAFEAQSEEEWLQVLAEEPSERISFREIYCCLFTTGDLQPDANRRLRLVRMPLDVRVILACLHAVARDSRKAQLAESIMGVPSQQQVRRALLRFYDLLTGAWPLNRAERSELMMCWHFVCIDTLCESIELLDQLCRHYTIPAPVFKTRSSQLNLFKALLWAQESLDAKSSLLHATAVHDIIDQLPLNSLQSFWTPMPILAVLVIYAIFRLGGISSVSVPPIVYWQSTMVDDNIDRGGGRDNQDIATKKTWMFLTSGLGAPNYAIGPARNLPFEMKKLTSTLHFLAGQWGIALEMEEMVLRFDNVCCKVT
jgi:hypothetical protein